MKRRNRKKLLLYALTGCLLAGSFAATGSKSYALTEAEIIAYLKENGYAGTPNANGQSDPAPGHEYGGSFDFLSQSAKDENDKLVRDRAAERGLTIRQYLEQTGQTCPATSSNQALLDVKPSGSGASTEPSQPAHKHSYKEEMGKEPTCTEKGLKTFTCDCGKSYTETLEMTDHVYEEAVSKEATCQEKGEKIFTCKYCSDSYVEESPKTDHEPGAFMTTKEPTCVEEGIREVFCKYCGEALKRQNVEALGHTPGEEQVETKAGIFKDGTAVIHCETCGEVLETRSIEADSAPAVVGAVAVVVLGTLAGVLVRKKKDGK